jgi:hypothetical protein
LESALWSFEISSEKDSSVEVERRIATRGKPAAFLSSILRRSFEVSKNLMMHGAEAAVTVSRN